MLQDEQIKGKKLEWPKPTHLEQILFEQAIPDKKHISPKYRQKSKRYGY